MKIRRELFEGSIIPTYYGIAYVEMDRMVAIVYPVPLNLIIGYLRKLWIWIRTSQSQLHDVKANAYKLGYYDGFEKGKVEAEKEVKRQAGEYFTSLNKAINEVFPKVRKPLKKLRGII